MRIAAVGDIHCTGRSHGLFAPLFGRIAAVADVLVLCGDLTDFGTLDEAVTLADELGTISIPIVGVLGNHDYESGKSDDIREILKGVGVQLLDGGTAIVGDVGFAGVKGFGGGFGRRMLSAFGEDATKRFVQESVEEGRKLETALSALTTPYRIGVMHYAPIEATTLPEPLELHAFLGASHLEDALDRNGATVAFHGHAHYGSPQGVTSRGIPVYNVALPLLRRHLPDQLPVRIVEVGIATPRGAGGSPAPEESVA